MPDMGDTHGNAEVSIGRLLPNCLGERQINIQNNVLHTRTLSKLVPSEDVEQILSISPRYVSLWLPIPLRPQQREQAAGWLSWGQGGSLSLGLWSVPTAARGGLGLQLGAGQTHSHILKDCVEKPCMLVAIDCYKPEQPDVRRIKDGLDREALLFTQSVYLC